MLVVLGLALSFGSYKVTFIDYLYSDMSKVQESVFTKIRFPRVLLSAFVGASLATSGACLQGLFRNPLADPGLIGVSAGAALGATSLKSIVVAVPSANLTTINPPPPNP